MMKYNKDEEKAIEILFEIATALKSKKNVVILQSENSILKKVLGIDLFNISHPKKNVDSFVRGKDEVLIELANCWSASRNLPNRYCFFPFQVKKIKLDNE